MAVPSPEPGSLRGVEWGNRMRSSKGLSRLSRLFVATVVLSVMSAALPDGASA